jgi:hypothetical protein
MNAACVISILSSNDIRAHNLRTTEDGMNRGLHLWTMRPCSLDTFRAIARRLVAPSRPSMPRPAAQLSGLDRQHASENAAVVQGCVPFVSLKGDSYRLRGKDLDARPSRVTA